MNQQTSDVEELIDFLTREQLIPPARLRQYLAERGGTAALPARAGAAIAEFVRDGLLTEYQRDQLAEGCLDDLRVGKYLLLERLGPPESSVFRARKRPAGPDVTVKLLLLDEGSDPASVERFRREAEALARLDHPGIVDLKEFGTDGKRHFLVTEHIRGQSLTDRVAGQGPLPPALAARIIQEALQALAHLHRAGLVHRDLRPAHLMLDAAERVHIVDLGVARFHDDPAGALTRQGAGILGSLQYLAPEQAIDSHDVDIRADIYALGATFYFLLTGRPPFKGQALLRMAAGAVVYPQPLAQLRPDVPGSLAAVVEKMMAPRPENRYQTPAAAALALQGWLLETSPPLPAERSGWGPALFRLAWLLLLAALTALAIRM